eukprot:1161909-Pelagomonas_calceolata.AAC.26
MGIRGIACHAPERSRASTKYLQSSGSRDQCRGIARSVPYTDPEDLDVESSSRVAGCTGDSSWVVLPPKALITTAEELEQQQQQQQQQQQLGGKCNGKGPGDVLGSAGAAGSEGRAGHLGVMISEGDNLEGQQSRCLSLPCCVRIAAAEPCCSSLAWAFRCSPAMQQHVSDMAGSVVWVVGVAVWGVWAALLWLRDWLKVVLLKFVLNVWDGTDEELQHNGGEVRAWPFGAYKHTIACVLLSLSKGDLVLLSYAQGNCVLAKPYIRQNGSMESALCSSCLVVSSVPDEGDPVLFELMHPFFLELMHGAAQKGSTYETQILETSIQKIGALLAVGFGDAASVWPLHSTKISDLWQERVVLVSHGLLS